VSTTPVTGTWVTTRERNQPDNELVDVSSGDEDNQARGNAAHELSSLLRLSVQKSGHGGVLTTGMFACEKTLAGARTISTELPAWQPASQVERDARI
jgi:hypothetical protein